MDDPHADAVRAAAAALERGEVVCVPTESSYGASLFTFGLLNGLLAFSLALMAAFLIARRLTGRLDAVRRLGFDVTRLFCGFALVQGVLTVALTHGFAWMVA